MSGSASVSKGLKIAVVILAVLAAAASMVVYLIVPGYEEIFANIGAELPGLTLFFLMYYGAFLWLPVFCLVFGGVSAAMDVKKLCWVSMALSVFVILMLPIALFAMYLPL